MNRTKIERETVISFNEEDGMASIWTASQLMINKMQKLGYKGETRGTVDTKFFLVPKKVVSIRKEQVKRIFSKDEIDQRKKMMLKINSGR